MAAESGVTPANWLDPPHNRSGLLHADRFARTERVRKGRGAVHELGRADRDLSGFGFEFEGARLSLSDLIARTYTDAMLVLHRGSIVLERYEGAMNPADPHLLMSVSKSIVSTLCGIMIGRRELGAEDLVTDHVDALAGTSWEGCTVQQLLDMRTGTEWEYDRDEEEIFDVSDYRVRSRTDLPADTATWIRTIGNSGEHGREFRYVSLVSDVLGWVLEAAAGAPLAELLSEAIWSRIGAERDASIIVDGAGFSIAEGGISATLRDVARFGQMCLERGQVGGAEVVPSAWFDELGRNRERLIGAFTASADFDPLRPGAYYHNNWWVLSSDPLIYTGLGVHGQVLLIREPSQSVVVKLSSQPAMEDPRTAALERAGLLALCGALG